MEFREESLSLFHPLIRAWFLEKYDKPTDVQVRSWPRIATGEHVLITAPTGSGKTMAAFLWALNQLISGIWDTGFTQVLYISPLKALNNDIRQNLLKPLQEITELFREKGHSWTDIHVLTRSGDTPSSERQRMIKYPPEIFITTPESLNLILSSRKAHQILQSICMVIIDEVHAIASQKRGTHLITAIDRLVSMAGEFQRIALSATVKPLERMADFVGGYRIKGKIGHPVYEKRPVSIVKSDDAKQFNVRVKFPKDAYEEIQDGQLWFPLVKEFKNIIGKNRSTLFFTNTRRLAEKITRLINEDEEREIAYSHHGSLSREIRSIVEKQLKEGALSAIVATSSLELGIDIGALDEVILIQSPPSVVSGIQRIGRAGHAVGDTSRGIIYPTNGRDFLDAAVMAQCIMGKDIEEARPVENPLDVLAQIIISMTGVETWNLDKLYETIKSSYPFHSLPRIQFNIVVEMLAGRYADTRVRELRSRVSIDRIDNTIRGREGVLNLLYHSGGTIPDRGYFGLRVQDTKAKIGELDEEFVWEREIGDTFNFGAGTWKITRIDNQNVEVVPWERPSKFTPFWKAEKGYRGFHLFNKIGDFLEYANDRIESSDFIAELMDTYFMDQTSAEELIRFLKRQKSYTGTDLPHRHHIVIEYFASPVNKNDSKGVVIHTFWGGRVNKPLSLALSAAWEEKYHYSLEVFGDDDSLILVLPHDFDHSLILKLVSPDRIETLLRRKLEQTGFFGAHFRENAGRSLLLPKGGFKKRMPLWMSRLRSKKLFDAVLKYENFPIILETWRECFQDEFELSNLKSLLDELGTGQIKVSEVLTRAPSPFAKSLMWRQTEKYMYEGDTPHATPKSQLSEELFKELVQFSNLRPDLDRKLIDTFQEKLHRIAPGYSPGSPVELLEWIKERILIPEDEWKRLLSAIYRDHLVTGEEVLKPLFDRCVMIRLPGATKSVVVALETLPRILRALELPMGRVDIAPIITGMGDFNRDEIDRSINKLFLRKKSTEEFDDGSLLSGLIGEWLYSYGPLSISTIADVFGINGGTLDDILDTLKANEDIVVGHLSKKSIEIEVCDTRNMEFLLRIYRAEIRPRFTALQVDWLPLFIAQFQGLTSQGSSMEDLQNVFEQLFGFPVLASLWEGDIFPSRLSPYFCSWLDSLMSNTDLMWFGCGRRRIGFCFSSDYGLFSDGVEKSTHKIDTIFPDRRGKYSFWELLDHSKMSSKELLNVLWNLTWQGTVLNDSWNTIRSAALQRYRIDEYPGQKRTVKIMSRNRWTANRTVSGNWYCSQKEDFDLDPLEELELCKERVRQLALRYGILFRQLLEYELTPMRWSRLFRALRIMELSGEMMSGYFFEGIAGLQFISHRAFQILKVGLPEDAVYWMNACDPASLCGLKLEGLKSKLPQRLPSNHLVYHGKRLVLISKRNGRELEFFVPPEDPNIQRYLALFRVFTTRDFYPLTSVKIETVNGVSVDKSPYKKVLQSFGFKRGYKYYVLQREY